MLSNFTPQERQIHLQAIANAVLEHKRQQRAEDEALQVFRRRVLPFVSSVFVYLLLIAPALIASL